MDLYFNGEVITKDRIQDEPWYTDWQTLNHMAWGDEDPNVIKWVSDFNKDYVDCFKKEYPNQDQLVMWANAIQKHLA